MRSVALPALIAFGTPRTTSLTPSLKRETRFVATTVPSRTSSSRTLIRSSAVESHAFDVVTARPGGAILLIEPDFLPVAVAEPQEVRAFWDGWLAWSRDKGIDYTIGRSMASRLAALGLEDVSGTAETAIFNGGSPWADYWAQTVAELRAAVGSGRVDDSLVNAFLAHCADPAWWTQTIAFTCVRGRPPPADRIDGEGGYLVDTTTDCGAMVSR